MKDALCAPAHWLQFSLWCIGSPDGFWQCCSVSDISHFLFTLKFSLLYTVFSFYRLSSRRFWMFFSSVPRSLWILSPVLKSPYNHSRWVSLRSCSPSASLLMKDGANELYMQMLWARCIPPRLGLYASVTKLRSAMCCPCRQLREMGVSDSESPIPSFRCLHGDVMPSKGVGTHGLLACIVGQTHKKSVQLKAGAASLMWGLPSTSDDCGRILIRTS